MTADDLKAWRAGLDLSQREAAMALGITTRAYQHLESGERPVSTAICLACQWIADQPK